MPIYLKYGTTRGSAEGKYAGWIAVESMGPADRSAAPGPKELTLKRAQDADSVALYRLANASTPGEPATLEIAALVHGRETPHLRLSMENTVVACFSSDGPASAGAVTPVETVVLNTPVTALRSLGKPRLPGERKKGSEFG